MIAVHTRTSSFRASDIGLIFNSRDLTFNACLYLACWKSGAFARRLSPITHHVLSFDVYSKWTQGQIACLLIEATITTFWAAVVKRVSKAIELHQELGYFGNGFLMSKDDKMLLCRKYWSNKKNWLSNQCGMKDRSGKQGSLGLCANFPKWPYCLALWKTNAFQTAILMKWFFKKNIFHKWIAYSEVWNTMQHEQALFTTLCTSLWYILLIQGRKPYEGIQYVEF